MGQGVSREKSGVNFQTLRPDLRLSVVIPALNEAGSIASTIESVRRSVVPPVEIIVVDGGSNDDTATNARNLGAKVLQSERGRGKQLNVGWRAARGDWCLFLHADSQLPPHYDQLIASALQRTQSKVAAASRTRWAGPREPVWRASGNNGTSSSSNGSGGGGGGADGHHSARPATCAGQMDPEVRQADPGTSSQDTGDSACRCSTSRRAASQAEGSSWAARSAGQGCPHFPLVTWGAFKTIRTDLLSPVLRELLATGVELRTRLRRQPYGDQAIFVRRDVLQADGGFKEWPLLEDLELVQRLRQAGPPAIVDAPVFTSGRRWRELGFFRTALINQAILLAFAAGVPPETLAGWYRNAKRHMLLAV